MTNREVAWVLEKIADLLEFQADNPYRINAYRKAAVSVYHLDEDLRDIYRRGALGEIEAVGKTVKAQIVEMLETGQCSVYERLQKDVPHGLLDMLAIPGLGHKKVRLIFDKTGIQTLDELEQAARQHKIRSLPGLGAVTEENILKGIDFLHRRQEKCTLGMAGPMAEDLCSFLKNVEGVERISPVGSIRRGKPLVGDIDILVAAQDFETIHRAVHSYPGIKEITETNQDTIRGYLNYNVKFEVIMVLPQDYYHSLLWTTGSKEHRKAFFSRLARDQVRDLPSEEAIYQKAGMQYIPPELRENRGEIEIALEHSLPELIRRSDIRGDLHAHTDWSDGLHTLEAMVKRAMNAGYSYLAITDHSRSLHISGGLSRERLLQQGQLIDELNLKMKGFRILKGTEVDILKDGSLDFDDELMEQLDVVIASIHSHFKLDRPQQTDRILRAIENPHVDVIGHLTGRLLNRRESYDLDIDQILAAAARHKKVLEINAHPDRVDIGEEIARKAADLGIKLAVNSDAHNQNALDLVHYGVLSARRAWLTRKDIVNSWAVEDLLNYFKR